MNDKVVAHFTLSGFLTSCVHVFPQGRDFFPLPSGNSNVASYFLYIFEDPHHHGISMPSVVDVGVGGGGERWIFPGTTQLNSCD